MDIAPVPKNEIERLLALEEYDILDTPVDPLFDSLTELAAKICGAPIALVSLIDHDRQWFKSVYGGSGITETPRDIAFCSHAILEDQLMEVPDASLDARFHDNPLVVADPKIRFYAGMPLRTPQGFGLGTLCVIDHQPRHLTAAQRHALDTLSRVVTALLERRKVDLRLHASEERFRSLAALSSDWYWKQDENGHFVEIAESIETLFKIAVHELLGRSRWEMPGTNPDPEDRKKIDEAIQARRPFRDLGYRIRLGTDHRNDNGNLIYVQISGEPIFDAHGKFSGYRGVGKNVTEQKKAALALQAAERFSRMTLDALPEHICVLDENGTVIMVNQAWRTFAIDDKSELQRSRVGSNYLEACDQATGSCRVNVQEVARGVRAVLTGQQSTFAIEYPRHTDTEQIWFRTKVSRFSDAGPVRVIIAHEDITARVKAEEVTQRYARRQGLIAAFGQLALANSNLDELQQEALVFLRDALDVEFGRMLQIAPDQRSQALTAGFGWDETRAGPLVPEAEFDTEYQYVLSSREAVLVDDFRLETRFRPSRLLSSHGIASAMEVPIAGPSGTYGIIGAFSREPWRFKREDIAFLESIAFTLQTAVERQTAEIKLAQLAQFDTLTGLPNRALFLDRLAQAVTQSKRNERVVGVLFIDLDRFKYVNDTLGHNIGDQLLIEVAQRLKKCIRSGDTVCRIGGDEFAVVISNLAKPDDAALVAQKILAACAPDFHLDGHTTHISASVGIALFPDDGNDPETLIKNADIAMYRAKELGRNRHQFFLPEMHERAARRLRTEMELRGALERNEFVLHYQPKADLYTGAIDGFEALLRWNHPERGLVPPFEFISVLEETGLIVPVGAWVIRTACLQINQWQQQGLKVRPIAVNVSARQFQQKDLDQIVGQILKETGVDPLLLELELTESMLMDDPEVAVQTLRNLKSYGIRLSVDDFGTGYSSLAYLNRFPLDALKIDRAFIRNCIANPDDATIALAIINLAHSLKLKVIAEGVETEAQLRFLKTQGCDVMQGYYFAKPLPLVECTRFLTRNARLDLPQSNAAADAVTILLVDDNEFDRILLWEALTPDNYRILTAITPEDAFDMLAKHNIDLVISDHSMPTMSGVKFLTGVRQLYPKVVRILASGTGDSDAVTEGVNEASIHKFLSKNWDESRLRTETREAYMRSHPDGEKDLG
jgi:diguanylate cyclase (GGDEF)-like protein/PAS domain S-box-containing protein